jgi:hypothetical protein
MTAPVVTLGRKLQTGAGFRYAPSAPSTVNPEDVQAIMWSIGGAEPPPGFGDYPQGAVRTAALYMGVKVGESEGTPAIDGNLLATLKEIVPDGSGRYIGTADLPWGHVYSTSFHGGGANLTGLSAAAVATGILATARGGTGLGAYAQGDLLYASAANVLAAMTKGTEGKYLRAGASVPGWDALTLADAVNQGTTATVLHGNAAGAPSFGAVSLTAEVSGILGSANGGTGNGFAKLSGPTTAEKTFTLPDASDTILTLLSLVNVVIPCGSNGAGFKIGYLEEEITLDTGGQTTDSVQDLYPANSTILFVMARCTVSVTGATTQVDGIGDASVADRFIAGAEVGIVAGNTGISRFLYGGFARFFQVAAAKARIAVDDVPTAGKYRVGVLYLQATAPTS